MRGAFGLAISGLGEDVDYLPEAPGRWPRWSIDWAPAELYRPVGAALSLNVGGVLDVLHEERRAVIATTTTPSADAIAHPWLATIGAWAANDRGVETFHAGGVLVDGVCWAVLGAKEAGKSTTLAAFHLAGHTVTSDDLVVLDGGESLSGPGCVDLRAPSAEAFGIGTRMELLPDRVRWRVPMQPPPPVVPFGGFILPVWSNGPSHVSAVSPAERLGLLYESRSALWRDDRGRRMLDLAAHPMLRWSRPRSLDHVIANLRPLISQLRVMH